LIASHIQFFLRTVNYAFLQRRRSLRIMRPPRRAGMLCPVRLCEQDHRKPVSRIRHEDQPFSFDFWPKTGFCRHHAFQMVRRICLASLSRVFAFLRRSAVRLRASSAF